MRSLTTFLVFMLLGCGAPLIQPGIYQVPTHTLIIRPWNEVAYEASKRGVHGADRDGALVMGFYDHRLREVWCAVEQQHYCYIHEIKHVLGLWDAEHREKR
jgi:hypothetical protein